MSHAARLKRDRLCDGRPHRRGQSRVVDTAREDLHDPILYHSPSSKTAATKRKRESSANSFSALKARAFCESTAFSPQRQMIWESFKLSLLVVGVATFFIAVLGLGAAFSCQAEFPGKEL